MNGMHARQRFNSRIFALCACLLFWLEAPAGAAAGLITSPANSATVSGTVSIVTQPTSQVSWVNFYLDNKYIASSPPYTDVWNSKTVANGSHVISVKGFASNRTLLATSSINVNVQNVAPTPSPSPTPKPTPSPTPKPSPTPTPIPSPVSITSPANSATVTGAVSIVARAPSPVAWVNFYADNNYIASSPPYTDVWDSKTVTNGSRMISVKAFASNGALVGTSSINVNVQNGSPTPSPTPTPSPSPMPTPIPKPSPTPSPTPTPVSGATYYIDSNQVGYNGSARPDAGSACALADADVGTSPGSPKCTLAAASAMQASLTSDNQVLFARGDTWNEELTITKLQGTAGHPIILGAYGSGALPVIDGSSKRFTCINAMSTTAKYITIDSFECRNTTEYGISFQTSGGAMPGITVQNSSIHNTGPGAYAGGSGAFDDHNYRNQLDFEDYGAGTGADGVRFLNNTVRNCGGHNCIQVHYDAGGPVVHGNIVGPGCVHNCIDLKGTSNATVDQNVATTGVSTFQGCIYTENIYTANSTVLLTRNVCYGSAVGFQFDTGGACVGHTHCLQTITAYNNTIVAPTNTAWPVIIGGSGAVGDIKVTWENNITDGGTFNVNPGVNWYGDYNDNGGHQRQYATNVTPGSHDVSNVDPGYVSFAAHDFHLLSTSPVAYSGLPGMDYGMFSMGAYSAP
jgi:chitodextrinase